MTKRRGSAPFIISKDAPRQLFPLEKQSHDRAGRDAAGDMETRSKRRAIEPVADKIRRGEISVFVAVAEELPEVFRTHVVPKLELLDTLALACVSKSYNAAVWSVEGARSIEQRVENCAKRFELRAPFPPKHVMAMQNNLRGLRALIDAGVDQNHQRQNAQLRNWEGYYMQVMLSNAGAGKFTFDGAVRNSFPWNKSNFKPPPNSGPTPLFHAMNMGQTAAVFMLLEAGANMEERMASPGFGQRVQWITALHASIVIDCLENFEMTKILLDAGADPNSNRDESLGWTPLHTIIFFAKIHDLEPSMGFRSLKVAELLMEAGANPHLCDVKGRTPLDVARVLKVDGMIKLLEKAITSSSD